MDGAFAVVTVAEDDGTTLHIPSMQPQLPAPQSRGPWHTCVHIRVQTLLNLLFMQLVGWQHWAGTQSASVAQRRVSSGVAVGTGVVMDAAGVSFPVVVGVPVQPAPITSAKRIARAKIRKSIGTMILFRRDKSGDPFFQKEGAGNEDVRLLDLSLLCRFYVMVDEPALIHALPVLRLEFSVGPWFHDRMAPLPADKAFQESGLLIDKLHDMFFLCHPHRFDLTDT